MAVILATASYDQTIRFWDAHHARSTSMIGMREHHASALAISPDKRVILAASNPVIRMYEVPTGARPASDAPVSRGFASEQRA
jgi:WD40 repeat protein